MNRHQRRAQAAREAGYTRCAEAMLARAERFLLERPGFVPRFNGLPAYVMAKVPAGVPEDKVGLAAAIPDVLSWWPADAETRELVEALEVASQQQGTYLQAKVAIEVALERRRVGYG